MTGLLLMLPGRGLGLGPRSEASVKVTFGADGHVSAGISDLLLGVVLVLVLVLLVLSTVVAEAR